MIHLSIKDRNLINVGGALKLLTVLLDYSLIRVFFLHLLFNLHGYL